MPLPEPYAGLVIRYSYLWKREQEAGREDGTKDRPCAVVMAIMDQDGEWEVLVLPITHSPPPDPADAIEIPAETKKRLGLDTDRSWIRITEANQFLWPDPRSSTCSRGRRIDDCLRAATTAVLCAVRDRFLERDQHEKSSQVRRTE